MFSILHLSDLHRSPHEPIDNDTLVAALLADRDRYVLEGVQRPDAIVISGDLIQGARLDSLGYDAEIRSQYDAAYRFLIDLANDFLDGDRSRLILTMGNHDICWNTARSAMRAVPKDQEPKDIVEQAMKPGGRFRWSWQDRCFYEIVDQDAYRKRLEAYWCFVERFYTPAGLVHPIDRDRGFNLFPLDNGRILIVALESVYGNDFLGHQGALAEGVVARCGRTLRNVSGDQRLRIAVWHHSVQGPPDRHDYMDVSNVHALIGQGFRLGLHGHQHLAEITPHYIHLPEQHQMAVVSAGSLCAGSRELPRGVDRQYNIVVVDDSYRCARIHLREMSQGNQFGRGRTGPFAIGGYVDVEWQEPVDAAGRPLDIGSDRARTAIIEAEGALRSGDPARAIAILTPDQHQPGTHGRRILLEASRAAMRWDLIVSRATPPATLEELVMLAEALDKQGDPTHALQALQGHAERVGMTQAALRDLTERLTFKAKTRR